MEKISPITAFCNEKIGFMAHELAGYVGLSSKRFRILEQGGYENLPPALLEFADEIRGPGGGAKLAADYQAFRDSLDEETKQDLENQLFPAGRWAGMVA